MATNSRPVVDLDQDELAADARGLADLENGTVAPHEEVKAWLLSWGTPGELPPPSIRTKPPRS